MTFTGMMAEVTSALTACGITICSCVVSELCEMSIFSFFPMAIQLFSQLFYWFLHPLNWIYILFVLLLPDHLWSYVFQAEVNKRRGMGVMLFHFEGSYENVVCLLYWYYLQSWMHDALCCLVFVFQARSSTLAFYLNILSTCRSVRAQVLTWFLVFLSGLLDVVGVHWVFLSASGYRETYVTTLVHRFTIISSKMEIIFEALHRSVVAQ